MEIEAAVQEMVERMDRSMVGTSMARWVIAEGTRRVGLPANEPLKLRMACRILVRAGITLDDLARRQS
jgi:hypothetical protein